MICAVKTAALLSYIFVPVLTALLALAFAVIVLKRGKTDTVAALMYELTIALSQLKADRLTVRQLKELDLRLSKLQMLADKAGYEDEYDVGVAQSALDGARKISAALYAAGREECGPYLGMIAEKLAPAADWLSDVTGIRLDDAPGGFRQFGASARRARAEKYLDGLDKRQF